MGGGQTPLQSPNHQQKSAQITISPPKNGRNHHHQVDPQITNHQEKTFKSPSIFSAKMTVLSPFSPCFRHILITKTPEKIGKSPSPQLLKITKSPIFSGTNHQITNKKIAKSPSPQLLKITKSPIFSCTNHQITNKKIAKSPITKN